MKERGLLYSLFLKQTNHLQNHLNIWKMPHASFWRYVVFTGQQQYRKHCLYSCSDMEDFVHVCLLSFVFKNTLVNPGQIHTWKQVKTLPRWPDHWLWPFISICLPYIKRKVNTTEHIPHSKVNQCCVMPIMWKIMENSSGSSGEPWGTPWVKATN